MRRRTVAAILSVALLIGPGCGHRNSTAATDIAAPTGSAPAPVAAASPAAHLDVNDVSFLWPVPKTRADADALISLADEASDGPIVPPAIFKALIDQAKTVSVDGKAIKFNSAEFADPKNWKVAGIRVNPTALGTHPIALQLAEVPGIRLIVQPVLVKNDKAEPQDFAAHVVFNYVLPAQPNKPDKEAFGSIVRDLVQLKAAMNPSPGPDASRLGVHPAFAANGVAFTTQVKGLLKKHLARKNLDKSSLAAISFMGIPGSFEPWIFFKVEVDTSVSTVKRVKVSGEFEPAKPESQMISFLPPPLPPPGGRVVPAPLRPKKLPDTSTAVLFPTLAASEFNKPLFQGENVPADLQKWQLRDVADIVANPQITTTISTDCVSCHTESTRRHLLPGLTSQPGTAFAIPAGISGVDPAVLPTGRWNLRNFGWGPNGAASAFDATVSQRAANEAAESADFINSHYLAAAAPASAAPTN